MLYFKGAPPESFINRIDGRMMLDALPRILKQIGSRRLGKIRCGTKVLFIFPYSNDGNRTDVICATAGGRKWEREQIKKKKEEAKRKRLLNK